MRRTFDLHETFPERLLDRMIPESWAFSKSVVEKVRSSLGEDHEVRIGYRNLHSTEKHKFYQY